MGNILKSFIRNMAIKHGKFRYLFVRWCKPCGDEYAEYLKRHGELHFLGNHCSVNSDAVITDPKYVSIGNNVILASCTLIGHDGSIAMLGRAYGVKLDRVGKIIIKDNVFIGHRAIILPGVTIGPNAVVGAGAVVTKDVKEGDIVGGVPAKPIGRVESLVAKLREETAKLPWADLINKREGRFDPLMEAELVKQRVRHFFEMDDQ